MAHVTFQLHSTALNLVLTIWGKEGERHRASLTESQACGVFSSFDAWCSQTLYGCPCRAHLHFNGRQMLSSGGRSTSISDQLERSASAARHWTVEAVPLCRSLAQRLEQSPEQSVAVSDYTDLGPKAFCLVSLITPVLVSSACSRWIPPFPSPALPGLPLS